MGFRPALIGLGAVLAAGCTSMNSPGASLEGTSWQVMAINQRATPHSDLYRLTFNQGRIGARFGCNHIGGSYVVTANTLVASDVASTLMGCPEPAATFETQGMAVLGQPMRLTWQSDRQMTLSNAAGSISLELRR